ncbi:MAG: uroporphyrinogen-III synthase, partial [Caulobacteraceae bacterium]
DAVLLHSPRAASVLARLLPGSAQDITAYALSEACAGPIREVDFKRVWVAPEPTESALLALLT